MQGYSGSTVEQDYTRDKIAERLVMTLLSVWSADDIGLVKTEESRLMLTEVFAEARRLEDSDLYAGAFVGFTEQVANKVWFEVGLKLTVVGKLAALGFTHWAGTERPNVSQFNY
jgi:hypothetical protein